MKAKKLKRGNICPQVDYLGEVYLRKCCRIRVVAQPISDPETYSEIEKVVKSFHKKPRFWGLFVK